jgi:hypothetical protein
VILTTKGSVMQGRVAALGQILLLCAALLVTTAASARAFDPEETFVRGGTVLSLEGTAGHFGTRLPSAGIQVWSLGARFSLIPFGVTHFERLHDIPDGALEAGLEPIFERFNTHQNFGGLAFELR